MAPLKAQLENLFFSSKFDDTQEQQLGTIHLQNIWTMANSSILTWYGCCGVRGNLAHAYHVNQLQPRLQIPGLLFVSSGTLYLGRYTSLRFVLIANKSS